MNRPARAAVATLALSLSPASAAPNPKNPGSFVYALAGDVETLDPHYAYDGVSHLVLTHIYETLLFFKGSSLSEFEPLLAAAVPSRENGLLSKDGRTYTFPIRQGVRFHDGSILTPEDVRYSLLRLLLMDRSGGPSALLLEPVLGVTSTRDERGALRSQLFREAVRSIQVRGDSVAVRLKAPFAPFLSVLANYAPILSKAAVLSKGGWDGTEATWASHNNPSRESLALHAFAAGTGPFRLERWAPELKEVHLARFDGYWKAPARLNYVVFRTVDEFATRKLLLSGGDADAIFAERQFQPQLEGLQGVDLEDDLPLLETTNCFLFTLKGEAEGNPYFGSGRLDGKGIPGDFFQDKDARLGLAYAFDYEAYLRDGYRGKGTQARGPIPRGVLGHDPKIPVFRYDPKRAAEHLKKAWGGKAWERGLRFTLAYQQGRADRQLACQIMKAGLEGLNPRLEVDVRGIQWSTYLELMQRRKLPMVNARWGLDYPDPHNAAFAFLHSGGHYPRVQGYSNPEADRLVEAAARETDPRRRVQLYSRLQRLAHEEAVQIFTVDTTRLLARRSWIKNWYDNPMRPYGYLYTVVKEDTHEAN